MKSSQPSHFLVMGTALPVLDSTGWANPAGRGRKNRVSQSSGGGAGARRAERGGEGPPRWRGQVEGRD